MRHFDHNLTEAIEVTRRPLHRFREQVERTQPLRDETSMTTRRLQPRRRARQSKGCSKNLQQALAAPAALGCGSRRSPARECDEASEDLARRRTQGEVLIRKRLGAGSGGRSTEDVDPRPRSLPRHVMRAWRSSGKRRRAARSSAPSPTRRKGPGRYSIGSPCRCQTPSRARAPHPRLALWTSAPARRCRFGR